MRKKLSYSPLTKKTNALIVDPKISPVYIAPMSHLKSISAFISGTGINTTMQSIQLQQTNDGVFDCIIDR